MRDTCTLCCEFKKVLIYTEKMAKYRVKNKLNKLR